jgi:hypothetical protein
MRAKQVCIAASVALIVFALAPVHAYGQGSLAARVAALEAAVAALRDKLASVTMESAEEINGLAGPHFIFTGVNVHIRSGSGATADDGTPTGLGNLIVGYNEPPGGLVPGDRGGAHTLVIGELHKFSSVGGLVAGTRNTVSGSSAVVSGGLGNTALGHFSSVCGGASNEASGELSTVSGGLNNTALGNLSSISGGRSNRAVGDGSSVSGGQLRSAVGDVDWVAGSLFEDF